MKRLISKKLYLFLEPYLRLLRARWYCAVPAARTEFEQLFEDPEQWGHLAERIRVLRNGFDPESLALLDERLLYMRRFPTAKMASGFIYRPSFFLSPDEFAAHRNWKKVKREVKKKYKIPRYLPEVFYFHHGLKLLPEKVLQYMAGKDFLDAGAFIGDSALVLAEYQPHKIYCCEVSGKNIETMRRTLGDNHIADKVEIVQAALGDHIGTIRFEDVGGGSNTVTGAGKSLCPLTTVDQLVKERNLRLGLVKADVEGMGLALVKGMAETLRRNRPIVSIAVYHNPEEFFGVKPYIEALNLNYRFRFVRLHPVDVVVPNAEETLLAYPSELE